MIAKDEGEEVPANEKVNSVSRTKPAQNEPLRDIGPASPHLGNVSCNSSSKSVF
jgi:hypothetical protein